jgi:hypothetical protein
MTIRSVILALPLAVLAACGSDSTAPRKFESGTYAVSSATSAGTAIPGTPECSGFLANYQQSGRTIVITVSGTNATIDTGGVPADSPFPTVTINGNALDQGTEGVRTISGSGASGTCNVQVSKTFQGDLTGDNAAHFVYTFKATKTSGTCDGTNSVILPIPCASAVDFLATKQ